MKHDAYVKDRQDVCMCVSRTGKMYVCVKNWQDVCMCVSRTGKMCVSMAGKMCVSRPGKMYVCVNDWQDVSMTGKMCVSRLDKCILWTDTGCVFRAVNTCQKWSTCVSQGWSTQKQYEDRLT